MTTLYMVKRGDTLAPSSPIAAEALAKIKGGREYRVDVTAPRQIGRHRWFWAFCQRVAENLPGDWTAEALVDALKVVTGHCTWVRLGDGTEWPRPKSIAFHAMDETAFAAFVDACIKAVCERIAPGMDPAAWADIEEILSK